MMHFSIGDKVAHPMHGAGRITGVEHEELVEGFAHYYVVEISGKGLTVFIPMRKVDELGVRPAMCPMELTRVLGMLGSTPQELPEDHKDRQDRILEKLKTGNPMQVAEAVRDLTWHKQLDHLTKADSRLLDRGRELLAAEMALVTDTTVADASEAIGAALTGATANET
jgi:CarD family transcriptional regulator